MTTEILSPMPGTIVEVNVAAGDDVQEGQVLMTLEAMKMENPIVSPVNGKIKEVLISKDAKVATKQLMIVIE